MTEEQLREKIIKNGRCGIDMSGKIIISIGLEEIISLFTTELELAKIEGIKLGWEESAEGYNNEYTSLCYVGGKRYTDDEVLAKVVKDILKDN
jgi:hypothetical protein